jgi:hypothetical protein
MREARDHRFDIVVQWERMSWKGIHKGGEVRFHPSALGQRLMRKPKHRFPNRMVSSGWPLLEQGLLGIIT